MRFAYADPPYPGQAAKLYACPEVDHDWLIQQLEGFDGWALSTSTPALGLVLGKLEAQGLSGMAGDYRVAAWVKPFGIFKPNVNPAYVWEPVIFRGWRTPRPRTEPTVRDWVAENITLKKGLTGAKPSAFCEWVCDLLGVQRGDVLCDLFPGTGIMGEIAARRTAGDTQRGE